MTMKTGRRKQGHAEVVVRPATGLPSTMQADVYELVKLHTDPAYRGRGEARSLLLSICMDADLTGKFLLVHVDPGDDTTTLKELAEFYSSMGFLPIQAEPLLMVRPHVRAGIAIAAGKA